MRIEVFFLFLLAFFGGFGGELREVFMIVIL